MNRTFNAFQMAHKPEITSYKKHIRLRKNMTLPDDTLEYWGFYLLEGSTVALSVCSRYVYHTLDINIQHYINYSCWYFHIGLKVHLYSL